MKTTDSLKEITITLNLPERAALSFNKLAGEADMSATELIESFITDLTDRIYAYKSNESDMILNWFRWKTQSCDYSFLSYLCSNHYYMDCVENLLRLQECADSLKREISNVKENKMTLKQLLTGLVDSEEVRTISDDYEKLKALYIEKKQEEMECCLEQTALYWDDYQKESSAETYEQAIKKLRKWKKESFQVR